MRLKQLESNAYYDMVAGKPKTIEQDNDGSWLYRYNIEPQMGIYDGEDSERQIGWQCRELRLFVEPTYKSLKQAIIDSVYNAETRLDLLNRFNAYMSAISDDDPITEEYKEFVLFCKDVDALLKDGSKDTAEKSVPRFVTNRQFRLMLISKGVDLDLITAEINKLPAPYKQQALVSWEYAPTFERKNPMIKQLAEKFGFSDEALDELFIDAEKL